MTGRRLPLRLLTLAAFVGLALAVGRSREPDEEPAVVPSRKVTNKAAHRPTPLPDRVILTWQTDPATSQAVTWRTDPTVQAGVAEIAVAEDSAAFAGYGKARGQTRTTQVRALTTPLKTDLNEAHCHSVNFTGLIPDTKYLYRVGDGANWSEWLEFKTAAAGPAPFTFLYFGDAQNDVKAHWSRVIRRAFADAPDARFLVHAGDLINTPNSDAEWGEWFGAGGWLNGMVPSVPTPGNHEWFDSAAPPPRKLTREEEEKAKAAPKRDPALYRGAISRHWRPQFALPENGPPGQEELTYYFDFQGVRIVSLNSNEGRNKSYADKEAQAIWLDGVLADNPNRWTIVTFHHPVFSPAKDRDNPDLRRLWQPVLDKYKVDLVLQGHDHTYARSGLVVGENVPGGGHVRANAGTVYAVSVSGPKMYELSRQDWMVSSAEGTQLYQVIRIDGDTLRYEARTATGASHDLFELRKQSDGTNELIERPQLEDEARGWWARNGLYPVLPIALLVSVAGVFVLRRWSMAGRP
jgi:3',5'-cyclic AMP phosphodiesterase CpdA